MRIVAEVRLLRRWPTCALLFWAAACAQVEVAGNGMTPVEPAEDVPAALPRPEPGYRQPVEPLSVSLFGRPLTIGAEYDGFLGYPDELVFDGDEADSTYTEHYFSVELGYQLGESVSFYADPEVSAEQDGEGRFRTTSIERNQAWLLFEEIFDSSFDITLGAQYFFDERLWWTDAVLDAISMQYSGERLQGEVGLAEQLLPDSLTDERVDPSDEDVRWLLASLSWESFDNHWLELFFIDQHDYSRTESIGEIIEEETEDDTDADLRWFGARVFGTGESGRLGRLDYWMDIGYVNGEETTLSTTETEGLASGQVVVDDVETVPVRGWGLDVGLTWQLPLPWEPNLMLSYAVGSGKLDENGTLKRAYRQTGLEGNSYFIGESTSVLYYGELLNPELSNIRIGTVGVRFPILTNSSVNILYHWYDQYRPVDFLRNAGIGENPSGEDSDLGQEVDLVVSVGEWRHWELQFTGALFRAGRAFGENLGDTLTEGIIGVSYRF